MPANTAITVAGPQLTIPGNLWESCWSRKLSE
jgi:hypothetical protein